MKSYEQLQKEFYKIFHTRLGAFIDIYAAAFCAPCFALELFEQWLQPFEDEKSIKDVVLERYGQEGVDIINELLDL